MTVSTPLGLQRAGRRWAAILAAQAFASSEAGAAAAVPAEVRVADDAAAEAAAGKYGATTEPRRCNCR